MSTFFLTSKLSSVVSLLPKYLKESPQQISTVFIPTAANIYTNPTFIDADIMALRSQGFPVTVFDIEGKAIDEVRNALIGAAMIVVGGGNTFYLLQEARKSGFDEVIKELVEKGVVYVGSSAGSVLAGPSLESIQGFDDPKDAPELTDYAGLNVVDFVILPHYNPEQSEEYDRVLTESGDRDYELKLLRDNELILVRGEEIEKLRV
jgi:dipeptidase E